MPSPPLILSDGPYAGQEVRESSTHAPHAPPYIGAHVVPAWRLRVQEIQTAPAVYKPVLHAGWASKPPNAAALAEIAACRMRALDIFNANPPTAEQKARLRKLVKEWQPPPEP
jgi:hypothetical protein|eukprot:jgi/Chrpa1/9091/Chrysochromulina_OHIO_Genome00017917-RA